MKSLTVLLALLFVTSAHAQSTPYPGKYQPTQLELDQLPYAIQVEFVRPEGWPNGHTSFGAYAIWPRNVVGSGSGAWFRSDTDQLVMSVFNDRVFPRPYSCRTVDAFKGRFECTDVLGQVRRPQCAPQLVGASEPSSWRSAPEDSADQFRGWHLWTWESGADKKWRAWAEFMTLPLATASTSDYGQRISCFYPITRTVGGPYERPDVWLMLR